MQSERTNRTSGKETEKKTGASRLQAHGAPHHAEGASEHSRTASKGERLARVVDGQARETFLQKPAGKQGKKLRRRQAAPSLDPGDDGRKILLPAGPPPMIATS